MSRRPLGLVVDLAPMPALRLGPSRARAHRDRSGRPAAGRLRPEGLRYRPPHLPGTRESRQGGMSAPLDAAAITQLHAHIHSRLAASCGNHGLRQPDQLHAVRFDPNVSATNAGAYVAKGGDWTPAEEMTRSDLKTGRTAAAHHFRSSPTTTRPATPATATSGANSAASPALCAQCDGRGGSVEASSASMRTMN
jgi:hypothetical protein